MERMDRISVKKGEIIYREGEMMNNMYQVVDGAVGIYTGYRTPDEQQFKTVRDGDYLNVISFLDSRPRSSTAVALSDCVLSVITMENFEDFFKERPAKILDLMQHMSRSLINLENAYLEAARTASKYYQIAGNVPDNPERYEAHKKTFRILSALTGNRS